MCLFENTNFLGGGLPESDGGQGIETSDVDHCDRECKKRGKCNYFTFVSEWKINCYLKARLGENSVFEGATSGTYGELCSEYSGLSCSNVLMFFFKEKICHQTLIPPRLRLSPRHRHSPALPKLETLPMEEVVSRDIFLPRT